MTIAASDLTLQSQRGHDTQLKMWHFSSADATADINTSGFVTGATARGLSVGDIIDHQHSSTYAITRFLVLSISSSDVTDLSDGTAIAASADAD